MDSDKDWRRGKKTRQWLSTLRKKRKHDKKKKENVSAASTTLKSCSACLEAQNTNKENDGNVSNVLRQTNIVPPSEMLSPNRCSAYLEAENANKEDDGNVSNVLRQMNIVIPSEMLSPNRLSPEPLRSQEHQINNQDQNTDHEPVQIIVQAEIHNETTTSRRKNNSDQNKVNTPRETICNIIQSETELNAIEFDVISGHHNPNSDTQREMISPTNEYNKSCDSDSDFELPTEIVGDTNCQQNVILEGNRIVDIAYFFEQLRSINHEPFQCGLLHLDFFKEKRTGLYSRLLFKCRLCNKIESIETQKSYRGSNDVPLNLNVIEGISQTGNGWSQLDEICASINIPNMSEKYYMKNSQKLATIQKDIALKLMIEAGAEEKRLAIENNDVDNQGIPCVTVVTDGSWSKRSYGTNFNSLSGVGCIIGHRTKKVLYIGVKNSYCCVCAIANNKKMPVPAHNCFKNWTGSSTEMETSAIVDGFKVSMEMHGIKYTKLIGDGDSSVTNALRDAMVYGPDVHIRKIECSNHLLRNYSNKLRKIAKKNENKVGYVPVILRKTLSDRVRRLHNAVTGAIAHARQLDVSSEAKAGILKEDLRNGPCHVFGWHDSCKSYYCKKNIEENLVPQLKSTGMWNDLYENLGWLLQNAESLLLQETNNSAEQFNGVIAKFLAGKRVNFTRRGTYEARCFSAVGTYNTGDYSFLQKVQKSICPDQTYAYTEKYMKKKSKNLEIQRKRRATDKMRGLKRTKRFKMADKYYGDITDEPDMPHDVFEKKKKDFVDSLSMSSEEIHSLERRTVTQANSDAWIVERKKRITASSFGQICKMKKTTSCASAVKTMLYSTFTGNDATRYGKAHEATAISEFEKLLNVDVTPCGLFIDIDKPYLGATPDGLIGTDGIIEIKCPASAVAHTPIEAIRLKKIKFCTETAGGIKLKKTHNYYFQVQGQLNITKRQHCYFVIWTPNGVEFEKIESDPTFWTPEKITKLEDFYFKCLLPELIDPRFPRKLNLRDRF